MKVSNCCGEQGYMMHQQSELCPKCGEHCEYVEEEETQKTALMELIEWVKCETLPLPITETLILAKATELLQKERQQIEEAYNQGYYDGCGFHYTENIDGADYYNKTYKQ